MAAGKQKKRLNAASIVSCNLQEQYRGKKKRKLESSQNLFNMRPHISLEWDGAQKKAVARREQIGISVGDFASFGDSILQSKTGLADVISIPQEIFGLTDLSEVLSCEIWKTNLSESERNLLTEFLPRGADADHVVQSLLSGENLHFGNPFLRWSALLCSGDLHPDTVVQRDKSFKANTKAYYLELQKYHNDMVGNLQRWKSRWISCKEQEGDNIEKIWRLPLKDEEDSPLSFANESRKCNLEENLVPSADSCSWAADEKVHIVTKEIALGKKGEDSQDRKGFVKHRNPTLLIASERAKVGTNLGKEAQRKLYTRSGDAATYMSYIKISRKQHDLVKKIKQCSDGIQSKSINRVLGDMKSFHVQPYETYEAEERKKLHEYWLQLSKTDLPAAFEHRKATQLQRQQWRNSLDQEIVEKKKPILEEDEERENIEPPIQEEEDCRETKYEPVADVQNGVNDSSAAHSTHSLLFKRIPSLNSNHEPEPVLVDLEDDKKEILKQETDKKNAIKQETSVASTKGFWSSVGMPEAYFQQTSTIHGCISAGELKQETDAPALSKFMENQNHAENAVKQEASAASAKGIWPSVGTPEAYDQPTSTSHGCISAGELSLSQTQSQEDQPTRWIDLETEVLEQETGESLLRRSPNDAGSALHIDSGASLLCYANQGRREVLPPFLKGQGMLPSYAHEHMNGPKQPGLPFLTRRDVSPENCQFPLQFQEQQQHMFEQRLAREKELYMHQMMQKNMYSSGQFHSQELYPSVEMQDWAADSTQGSPFQTSVNRALLSPSWFSNNPRPRTGWSGVGVSSTQGQCLEGVSNTDDSLFSVLSQCGKLQSCSSYGTASTEQYFPVTNFVGNNISRNVDTLTYSHEQLNYLNNHEDISAVIMKVNSTSWTGLPHPHLNLHDPVGKPFLRPWK